MNREIAQIRRRIEDVDAGKSNLPSSVTADLGCAQSETGVSERNYMIDLIHSREYVVDAITSDMGIMKSTPARNELYPRGSKTVEAEVPFADGKMRVLLRYDCGRRSLLSFFRDDPLEVFISARLETPGFSHNFPKLKVDINPDRKTLHSDKLEISLAAYIMQIAAFATAKYHESHSNGGPGMKMPPILEADLVSNAAEMLGSHALRRAYLILKSQDDSRKALAQIEERYKQDALSSTQSFRDKLQKAEQTLERVVSRLSDDNIKREINEMKEGAAKKLDALVNKAAESLASYEDKRRREIDAQLNSALREESDQLRSQLDSMRGEIDSYRVLLQARKGDLLRSTDYLIAKLGSLFPNYDEANEESRDITDERRNFEVSRLSKFARSPECNLTLEELGRLLECFSASCTRSARTKFNLPDMKGILDGTIEIARIIDPTYVDFICERILEMGQKKKTTPADIRRAVRALVK